MIRYTTGNIMDSSAEALVNTVNTVGVMGKGIAMQFKRAFPHNFEVYRQACLNGQLKTGQVLVVKDNELLMGERLIINLPTKAHWRLPSKYEYIDSGLQALRDYLMIHPVKSLAMPALGCGNGGLDRKMVKPKIEENLADLNISIWVYEPALK